MSRTISAFTTMNREIFDRFGQKMIDSFIANVRDFDLTVYVEGFVLPPNYLDKVKQVPLSETQFNSFREMCEPYPERSGLIDDVTKIGKPASWKAQIENGQQYYFQLDAMKFSRKVFCLYHFCHETTADVALLMDADTQVKKPVTANNLLRMFPEESTIALLRRDHEYSETGFYMVNLRNKGIEFVDHYIGLFLTGEVFSHEKWHDSYMMDRAIEQTGHTVTSLSGRGSATNHPLANGPLGRWFYHEKGKYRKKKHRKR